MLASPKSIEWRKSMNYMVCTRGKRGPVFGTLEEASAYELKHRQKTGNFVAIIMTARKITHRMEV